MKTAIKLFVAIFFILGVIKTLEAQETRTIGGKVRYSDNNQLVTSGTVKLFNSSGICVGVTPIQPSGDWIIVAVRLAEVDVIGIADDEWEDFVPTGYPDKTDPAMFSHILVNDNLSNIDIYVQRTAQHRPGITTNISGNVTSNNKPVENAVVYAKQGNEFVGFGISDKNGNYSINNLPVGEYILVAHKIASESSQINVSLTENQRGGYNFELKSKSNGNTNPFEYALAQNYPNPFNPNTVISYSVAAEGNVTLQVFNAAGQLVNELVNAEHQAGIYNVEFNAALLSSGVYFYRLESNGFTATNKMILVK